MHLQYAYFVLTALIASATASNSIKCYSCQSTTNPHCTDPINTGENGVKAETCSSGAISFIEKGFKGFSNLLGLDKSAEINYVCVKASYTNTTNGKEEQTVVRGCSLEGGHFCDIIKEAVKKTSNNNNNIFCEECTSDECNGSYSVQATLSIFVPAIALLWASLN